MQGEFNGLMIIDCFMPSKTCIPSAFSESICQFVKTAGIQSANDWMSWKRWHKCEWGAIASRQFEQTYLQENKTHLAVVCSCSFKFFFAFVSFYWTFCVGFKWSLLKNCNKLMQGGFSLVSWANSPFTQLSCLSKKFAKLAQQVFKKQFSNRQFSDIAQHNIKFSAQHNIKFSVGKRFLKKG